MRRRPAALALAALAALLSGCGPDKDLDFDLRAVSITVPRLVTPAIAVVPRPSAPLPTPLPPFSFPVTQPPALAPAATPPPPPIETCPKASPFAAPDRAAAIEVKTAPAAGVTVQRATGDYALAAGKGGLGGIVTVTTSPSKRSTSSAGQVVDDWTVQRTDTTTGTSSLEAYRLVQPSTAPLATSAGVYLTALRWTDPVRGTLQFTAGGNGLWVLPTPVQYATDPTGTGAFAQHAGSDTDAQTLTTVQLVRNVLGRKRVDVCGQLVDTQTVEMTGTITAPGKQWQVSWVMQLATAYGPIDVESDMRLSDPQAGTTWNRTLRNVALPKDPS